MRISRDPSLGEVAAMPGAAANGDSAEISSLSTRIMDALAAGETKSAGRVAALSALYARGDYLPDASALSRALISHALGGAVSGEE
jgi:hypothetical protein